MSTSPAFPAYWLIGAHCRPGRNWRADSRLEDVEDSGILGRLPATASRTREADISHQALTAGSRNPRILTIDDARTLAKYRQPQLVFDFIEGAALTERAHALNSSALSEIRLMPRVMIDVRDRNLDTVVLGQRFDLPFGVAPMGMAGLAWPGTDAALARASTDAGIPLGLSTAGSMSIEETRDRAGENAWFQLYVRQSVEESFVFVDRARAAGYDTLILTVDSPELSRRIREIRNGFTLPFRMGFRQFLDFASHPRWSLGMLRAGTPSPVNFRQAASPRGFVRNEGRETTDWALLERLRQAWAGRLIVKGVMSSEDAVRIQEAGADAIYVSNHGGRQFDSAPASIFALPKIRRAVGPDYPLIFDGGVRNGEDIVKALAMGADFVMLGRAFLYAAGAGGEAGIRQVIDILAMEISLAMAQIGVRTISAIDSEVIADSGGLALAREPQ